MSSHRFCSVERDGHLLVVTINRPERLNALHPPANEELERVFDDFAADRELWVAILTGAGERAFSAGHDLRWQAEGNPVTVPSTGFAGLTCRFDLDKPVIAAVNGFAMGGGFEIALACDLIVASDTATFALPEPKVGLAALSGGLHRLPRQISLKRAMSMILTGRSVSAAEGEAFGFVNEVVPASRLLEVARRWADAILACSPMSTRASKQTVLRGLDRSSLPSAIAEQSQNPAVRALLRSADAREGPLAFSQKRKAEWQGQ